MVLKQEKEQPQTRNRDGLHCDLCGCSAPAVRCDLCSQQIFCSSCDDMYHRHPKRRTHVRKAIGAAQPSPHKAVVKGSGDPTRLPVPPPRRRKSQSSQKSVPSSPLLDRKTESQNPPLPKKEFSFMDKVGSLRRFMIGRPLPPVPKDDVPDRPPKSDAWSQPGDMHSSSLVQNDPESDTGNSYSNVNKKREQRRSNHSRGNERSKTHQASEVAEMDRNVNKAVNGQNNMNKGSSNWADKTGIGNQSAYPSTLNRSEVDATVQMGFQGFPTMLRSNSSNFNPGRMTMDAQGSNMCSTNRNYPDHPGMNMLQHPQSMQGLNYYNHPQMGYNEQCMLEQDRMGYNPAVPWMNNQSYVEPYRYYPNIPPYAFDGKRVPSSSSISGSESGCRHSMNSYASMGHLQNPTVFDNRSQVYPREPVHSHRAPSPAHSVQSGRLSKAQSMAVELPGAVHYRSGRRATAHGFPVSGRRSTTSSEEDYFSAGASDDDDYRSIRSATSTYNRNQAPNRQWQCEHCTYINAPDSRICSVCCKTSHQKAKSKRRRAGIAGTAKSPSSGDSLPPSGYRRGSHESSSIGSPSSEIGIKNNSLNEHAVDNDEKETLLTPGKELEESKIFVEQKHNPEAENSKIISVDAIEVAAEALVNNNVENYEANKKASVAGTSPAPQNCPTQTGSRENVNSEETPHPSTLYRSNSRSSLSGTEQIVPHLRRTSSVHIGPGGDAWNSTHNQRSSSRASLFTGSHEPSPPRSFRGDLEYQNYKDHRYPYEPLNRTDYYLSLEELIERRRQETMRVQGFELVRLLREAEQYSFTADDLQVALNHCGTQNPILWLHDNWKNMIETVVNLVTNYGKDKPNNDIGIVSTTEAKESLRVHKGNIWAAVTDCVEIRQKKFVELNARGGQFLPADILTSLTDNNGNIEAAYLELCKKAMKPFHDKLGITESQTKPSVTEQPAVPSLSPHSKSPIRSISPRSKSPLKQPSPHPSVITGTLTLPIGATSDLEQTISKPENSAISTAASSIVATSSVASTASTATNSDLFGKNQEEIFSNEHAQSCSVLPTAEIVQLISTADFKTTSGSSTQPGDSATLSWRLASSGGGSAVGGLLVQEVNNDKVDFQPAAASSRLSRTGSFSGGAFQDKESSNSLAKINDDNLQTNLDNDLYVTVQWASGQKPLNLIENCSINSEKPLNITDIIEMANNKPTEKLTFETNQAVLNENAPTYDSIEKNPESSSPVTLITNSDSYASVEFITSLCQKTLAAVLNTPTESNQNVQTNVAINGKLNDTEGIVLETDAQESIYASFDFIKKQDQSITHPKASIACEYEGDISAIHITNGYDSEIQNNKAACQSPGSILPTEQVPSLITNIPLECHSQLPLQVTEIDPKDPEQIEDYSETHHADDEYSLKQFNYKTSEDHLHLEYFKSCIMPQSSVNELVNNDIQNDLDSKGFESVLDQHVAYNLSSVNAGNCENEINEQKHIYNSTPIQERLVTPLQNAEKDFNYEHFPASKVKTDIEAPLIEHSSSPLAFSDVSVESIENEITNVKQNALLEERESGSSSRSSVVISFTDSACISPNLQSIKDGIANIGQEISSEEHINTYLDFLPITNVNLLTYSQTQSPVPQSPSPVPQSPSPIPQSSSPVPQNQSPVPQNQSPILCLVPQSQSPIPRLVPQSQSPLPRLVPQNQSLVPGLVSQSQSPVPHFVAQSQSPIPRLVPQSQSPVPGLVAQSQSPVPGLYAQSQSPIPRLVPQNQSPVPQSPSPVPRNQSPVPQSPSPVPQGQNPALRSIEQQVSKSSISEGSVNAYAIHLSESPVDVTSTNTINSSLCISPLPPNSKEQIAVIEECLSEHSVNSSNIGALSNSLCENSIAQIAEEKSSLEECVAKNTDSLALGSNNVISLSHSPCASPKSQSIEKEIAVVEQNNTFSESANSETISLLVRATNVSPLSHSSCVSPIPHSAEKESAIVEQNSTFSESVNSGTGFSSVISTNIGLVSNSSHASSRSQSIEKEIVAVEQNYTSVECIKSGIVSSVRFTSVSSLSDSSCASSLSQSIENEIANVEQKNSSSESINSGTVSSLVRSTNASPLSHSSCASPVSHSIEKEIGVVEQENNSSESVNSGTISPSVRSTNASPFKQSLRASPLLRSATASPVSMPTTKSSLKSNLPVLCKKDESIATARNRLVPVAKSAFTSSSKILKGNDYSKTSKIPKLSSVENKKPLLTKTSASKQALNKPSVHSSLLSVSVKSEKKKFSSKFERERHARMLLAEGKVSTYDEAEIVVKLIELSFTEEDAFLAAHECSDVDCAITFLQQDCELCANKYPMGKMVSMLNCTHRCCQECAIKYFSLLIRDRNIMETVCPFCDEPDLTDDDIAQEYFNNLDIILKSLVDTESHELFQRKLRDRTLMKDPDFHWCSQCSSGFIAPPLAKRLDCPDCGIITCAHCRKPWEQQHEGISCEQFVEWKDANDPEFQAKGLEKHLAENGIDCPNCRFRYALAKGGCMHFRCLQCQYDFCSGCGRPFKMGQKCNFSMHCTKLGLHAHHPRNCLFYLRDKEPEELQKLLTENGIVFDTEPIAGLTFVCNESGMKKCPVMEQKEIPGGGLKDDICGNEVKDGYAGLCRLHYVEYLGNFIKNHNIDPIAIYTEDDLEACLRRSNVKPPARVLKEAKNDYLLRLQQVIKEQIPLDELTR